MPCSTNCTCLAAKGGLFLPTSWYKESSTVECRYIEFEGDLEIVRYIINSICKMWLQISIYITQELENCASTLRRASCGDLLPAGILAVHCSHGVLLGLACLTLKMQQTVLWHQSSPITGGLTLLSAHYISNSISIQIKVQFRIAISIRSHSALPSAANELR